MKTVRFCELESLGQDLDPSLPEGPWHTCQPAVSISSYVAVRLGRNGALVKRPTFLETSG